MCAAFLSAGCSRPAPAPAVSEPAFSRANPRTLAFQTDWFPQAEHGGFYQALAKGYYAEAGLTVAILPGGPGMTNIKQLVARGDAQFAMYRSDSIVMAIAQDDLPFTLVSAVTQHDLQALMVRAGSPVRSFADLGGRTIVANPGQPWLAFLERKYGVKFNLLPNMGGLAAFLGNPELIQQAYLTSEPFKARQSGVEVRTLPLVDAGYDSYTVLFGRRDFVDANPAATKAFIAASLRGWKDFLEGDPAPAFAEIQQRNPNASMAGLEFARAEMIRNRTITGDPAKGEAAGRLDPSRLRQEVATLVDLKIITWPIPVSGLARPEYLAP